MSPRALADIEQITRSVEAHASLEQDIVRYAAPVLAGIRASAMFSCPLTRKPLEQMAVERPQVLLEKEFDETLAHCRRQLWPFDVSIIVLAHRESSALVFIYRPRLLRRAIACPAAAEKLAALGYEPLYLGKSINELKARLRSFDALDRPRDFWDFPHEVGYFLGYPPADVMAYTRNRGANYTASGTWQVYGCKRRVAAVKPRFAAFAECTRAYWKLYLDGASLSHLAALGTLGPIEAPGA